MKTPLKQVQVRLLPKTAPGCPADDKRTFFSTRLRASTIAAIQARAAAEGATLKQVVCRALLDAGIEVASVDLENNSPRRGARSGLRVS